jgi:calcineurin-like phosphoesterase
LDGRVAAVLGTHTHVQTADERVLPGGTAFIGDVGMAGPRDGIIGGDRALSLKRFLTGVRVRLSVAEGDAQFCAVIVEADESTGRARSIARIQKTLERK